ncbi:MAG TPA: CHAT domain-containing protein [Pyrinomonadaceae bacterium]|jgi:CHAT domain-containing protein
MERAELAARLIAADDAEREALLQSHKDLADAALAYTLKDICLDSWASDPATSTASAAALEVFTKFTDDGEVSACAAWSAGLASLVAGQMERAIEHLDDAEARFLSLHLEGTAAATRVSELIALAILGRYDEAVACGLKALEVLEAHGDILAAGKIEHNIGNIYWRRDRYDEAEHFFRAARVRFEALKDDRQLAMIENCLAYIQSLKHDFRSAGQLYDQALKRAQAIGNIVTQAEIESSMGNLALFQGRYDRALDYLERARRKYAEMRMPHESAVSELEIADAYLELNLGPEAAEFYERVTPMFAELSMRAEQALALAHHGRAAILLGQMTQAQQLLTEARKLYAAEGNALGEAMVALTMAQLHHATGNYPATMLAAEEAESPLAAAGVWRNLLMARWLRGDALRALGSTHEARAILEAALHDALEQAQPQVAQRCHTSLGLLAADAGEIERAEAEFKRAIELIETLRAPLPAEEFRAAFFSDKLVPYDEMARLYLASEEHERAAEALSYVERARSRALVDILGGALKVLPQPRDDFEAELLTELQDLREQLNWFYNQINRPAQKSDAAESADEMAALQSEVKEREHRMLEITRQLQHRGEQPALAAEVEQLNLQGLQQQLGEDTALVEYTSLDGELLAFVVTDESVSVVRHLGSEREVEAQLEQLRFQIDTLRFGAERMRKHLPHLTKRALSHLQALYDVLLAPLEEYIGEERRLVIVPHRALHYVPFHALHDGIEYVIERREVCYAPSAVVLHHCLAREPRALRRAVLVGVPDEQTPRVRDEVIALAPLFPETTLLLDEQGTLAAVKENAARADVLHLACHGQFRPDNPLFSSLRLAGDWLTVRDAYELELRSCELVTLSACETGMSAVAPGDELIGLARGFFSAGAPSLLMSLWTVDDEATANLMTDFYSRLCAGASAATALRLAQLELMKEQPHPFFWSPFVLFGRW